MANLSCLGKESKAEGETDESEEHALMEARIGEAFAGTEHLTVIGSRLHPGASAPGSCLSYLDVVDLAVHTVRLSDLTGIVRLFSMVNSVERPVCQVVTRRWETFRETLPPEAYLYTISMDTPQVQADFQDRTGVLHQSLSAHHTGQFGRNYGVWRKRVAPPAEVSGRHRSQ